MNPILTNHSWLNEHRRPLIALGIFVVAFIFLLWLQADPTFADPDSFYHAKSALILRDEGVVEEFPWLQFTNLNEAYTNQHFLYHAFLIPFVTAFDPVVGVKIATILLAAGLILLSYLFLSSFRVRLAWLYPILLLVVTPFVFRISLAKAPSVSIMFLIAGIWLMMRGKHWWLFALSFAYVWAYGGFALILIAVGLWSGLGILKDVIEKRKHTSPDISGHSIFYRVIHNKHVRTIVATVSGVIAGVVINPYFPQNLSFIWSQLVKIGIVNYRDVIGVGNEWYSYKFIELISNTIFLTVIVLVAAVLFVIFIKNQRQRSWFFILLTIFFFVLTLKSKRYVEYYVPFGMLFGAFSLHDALTHVDLRKFLKDIVSWYFRQKIFATILLIYFLITLPVLAVRDIRTIKRDLGGGSNVQRFAASSEWLAQNTPQGAVVFHSSWDEFPILFYHNSHNYYIIGLDPTFMYEYDKELYKQMVDITTGVYVENVGTVLKEDFRSSYVFVEKNHTAMKTTIENISGAKLVYSDDEAWIYDITGS